MTQLNKVLVATHPQAIEKKVLSAAVALAKSDNADVTICSVAEHLPAQQLTMITQLPPSELMETMLQNQLKILGEAVEELTPEYDNVSAYSVAGSPFIEITKKVQRDSFDMVVLASKSDSLVKHHFGSTTKHLMRKCPCPVLALGEHSTKPIKRILAAVDVFSPSEEGLALNNQILRWAKKMAAMTDSAIHIVHAWQTPSDAYLLGWNIKSQVERVELIMKEQQARQQFLTALIAENFIDGDNITTELIEGKPTEVISGYVEQNDIDLVVVGTVCRTGIAGFFIGNTAESLLNEVSCSVLALKPEGFTSPIC